MSGRAKKCRPALYLPLRRCYPGSATEPEAGKTSGCATLVSSDARLGFRSNVRLLRSSRARRSALVEMPRRAERTTCLPWFPVRLNAVQDSMRSALGRRKINRKTAVSSPVRGRWIAAFRSCAASAANLRRIGNRSLRIDVRCRLWKSINDDGRSGCGSGRTIG